jgi:hypothetical protein
VPTGQELELMRTTLAEVGERLRDETEAAYCNGDTIEEYLAANPARQPAVGAQGPVGIGPARSAPAEQQRVGSYKEMLLQAKLKKQQQRQAQP